MFIAKVALYRDLDPAQIRAVEGGMLIGQQAIDAGLADMLSSEQSALEALITNMLPARRRGGRRAYTQAALPSQ